MIEIFMYVIKDMKGNFDGHILSCPNDDAVRRLVPFIVEGNEMYKRYPSDFVVYRIGAFDCVSGTINAENTPVFVCDLDFGGNKNADMEN